MIKFSVNDLRETSSADLDATVRVINEELQRRRNEARQHLINEFQKVWGDLKAAHIRVSYCEDYDCDTVYLDDWDGFSFD